MAAHKQSPVFHPAKRREFYKNAVVGWYPPESDAYAEGYFNAAEVLVAHALAGPYKDRFIFPICYMYRHAIELMLKELIRKADTLIWHREWLTGDDAAMASHENVDEFVESTHSIESLYDVLMAKLALTHPGSEIPLEVRAAIIELHHRDSNGEAFRYARAKGTGKAVFQKQESFDIERIAKRLGETFRFLSWGVGSALSADLDAASDYLRQLEEPCC